MSLTNAEIRLVVQRLRDYPAGVSRYEWHKAGNMGYSSFETAPPSIQMEHG